MRITRTGHHSRATMDRIAEYKAEYESYAVKADHIAAITEDEKRTKRNVIMDAIAEAEDVRMGD